MKTIAIAGLALVLSLGAFAAHQAIDSVKTSIATHAARVNA